jgi:hypothetical protein
MNDRIDHAAQAREALKAGRESVTKARIAAQQGWPDEADAHGKKAHGCWMQAQAEATLALVEQKRIQNLLTYIALPLSVHETESEAWLEVNEGLGL